MNDAPARPLWWHLVVGSLTWWVDRRAGRRCHCR